MKKSLRERLSPSHKSQNKTSADYKGNVLEYDDMQSAFDLMKKYSKEGDVCLLSPAAASYDRYKNFEERGKVFKELAEKF